MFQIKICGLTTPEDALAAIEVGADALGLNFHPPSPRYVTPPQAAHIVQAVRQAGWGGVIVAVVVHDESTLAADPQLSCVDAWQLHGEQSPDDVKRLRALVDKTLLSSGLPSNPPCPGNACWRVIRALAWRQETLSSMLDYLHACQRMGALPDAWLIDAFQSGLFGGTGRTFDWDALATHRAAFGGRPLILAGGLTPENVATAIQRVQPAAVDVASGVEASPGRKDAGKLRAFVAAARSAFQSMARQ